MRCSWLSGLSWVVLLAATTAHADKRNLEAQLASLEQEAAQLGTDLPNPNEMTGAQGQRRLVDAEVAYSLGDYDTAALMLYDLASKPGADQETATYYLAESLFQKGDRGAARTYFEQVVAKSGKYYQASLLRLVEIAIALRDTTNVANHLSALNNIGSGTRKPEVTYVRGKYAFFEGKIDEALAYLQDTPKGSSHDLQATFYIGTAHVAKKDLTRATEIFTELITRKPKTANDRRVIELAQIALGRLYYERDQPSKAIDSYLMIDRKSDLFPDALYEVSWVYVKGKQYDKALRALELLALSEPNSQKTPTVRLLEGNLRIRKAQIIRLAQITGTLDANLRDADPAVEYDKAAAVFAETRDLYLPSYVALSQMLDSTTDPGQYLAQLANRSQGVFQTIAPIPEAAAQYLREEPEVQRVVAVEMDLGDVENNVKQSEAIIARLEAVLAANDRTAVYPALQGRRSRIGSMQEDLIKIRANIADQLAKGGGGEATMTRRSLLAAYQAAPNAEQQHTDRVEATNGEYDKIETSAAEVASAIDSTQAVAVALRKYSNDANPPLPADQKTTIATTLDEAAKEAQAIEAELADLQGEIQLGRDLAGVGDEGVKKAREARKALKVAQDAEHRALANAGGNQGLIALGDRATRIADNLNGIETQIDSVVDKGMEKVKVALVEERKHLAGFKTEVAEYSKESREIGGTVLAASFKDVKAKFYDIVVRADVGNVDVSWSQKEDNDDDLKRLNMSRQRELKQLKDEFRDVLEPREPKKSTPPAPLKPDTEPAANGGSPDKTPNGDRVKPGGDLPKDPKQPVVRPDNETPKQPAPKQPAPKKGGGR